MVPLWVSMIRAFSRRAVMAPMDTVTGRGAVNAGLPGRPEGSICALQANVPCQTPSRSLIWPKDVEGVSVAAHRSQMQALPELVDARWSGCKSDMAVARA
jgi:hypothetical protein